MERHSGSRLTNSLQLVKFHNPHEFPDLRQNPDPQSVSNFQGLLEQATAEAINAACAEKTRQVLQGCLQWNPLTRASAADMLKAAPFAVQNIKASATEQSPASPTSPASTISTVRLTREVSTPSPGTPSRQLQAALPAMSPTCPEPQQHGHTNMRARTNRYVLDVPHTPNGQSGDRGLGTDAGVWFEAYMYACTLYDSYSFTCERGSGTYIYLMHKNTCAKLLGTGCTKLGCECVFRCETIRSIRDFHSVC